MLYDISKTLGKVKWSQSLYIDCINLLFILEIDMNKYFNTPTQGSQPIQFFFFFFFFFF